MNTIRQYSSVSGQRQRGISLVEILVALVLGLVLMGGIIQLLIGSKQTYRFYDALSRIQENGRFALEAMARDIRMAGFSPPSSIPLANAIASNGNDITVRWRTSIAPLVIVGRTYSIGPRVGAAGPAFCASAGTSLLLDRNDGAGAQEMIEGVQAMQILYGICTTDADGDGINDSVTFPYPGAASAYVNAATITADNNWDRVCSVRINLLLVSLEDRVVTEPRAVVFPADTATTVAVNDRCLRQAFSKTIAIRNRIP